MRRARRRHYEVNTRFVETFVTLCRLRSFRATANVLHATPAAISMRIKALEDELRVALIDRTSPDFRLTPQGEGVLAYARKLLDSARALEHFAHDAARATPCLRLGVAEAVVHTWLADYIRALHDEHPRIEIALTVDTSENLHTRLFACELDLAIQTQTGDATGLVSTVIAQHSIDWVARRGWLSDASGGAVAKREQPVLLQALGVSPGDECSQAAHQLAARIGKPATDIKICILPSIALTIRLLRDGFGVGALPTLCVASLLKSGELERLPVGAKPQPLIVTLLHAEDANETSRAAAVTARTVSRRFCAAMST
jgi:DNA-binding transcriptional LysR family regulator